MGFLIFKYYFQGILLFLSSVAFKNCVLIAAPLYLRAVLWSICISLPLSMPQSVFVCFMWFKQRWHNWKDHCNYFGLWTCLKCAHNQIHSYNWVESSKQHSKGLLQHEGSACSGACPWSDTLRWYWNELPCTWIQTLVIDLRRTSEHMNGHWTGQHCLVQHWQSHLSTYCLKWANAQALSRSALPYSICTTLLLFSTDLYAFGSDCMHGRTTQVGTAQWFGGPCLFACCRARVRWKQMDRDQVMPWCVFRIHAQLFESVRPCSTKKIHSRMDERMPLGCSWPEWLSAGGSMIESGWSGGLQVTHISARSALAGNNNKFQLNELDLCLRVCTLEVSFVVPLLMHNLSHTCTPLTRHGTVWCWSHPPGSFGFSVHTDLAMMDQSKSSSTNAHTCVYTGGSGSSVSWAPSLPCHGAVHTPKAYR